MPLFIGEHLADTMHLTTEQHGAFILILLKAWRSGGYVPDDDATLAAITRMPLEAWRNNRAVIVGLLEKRESGLCYPRQLEELERASERRNVAFSNGIKGGRPKNNPNKTQPITQTKPKGKPKRNPQETSLPSPLPLQEENTLSSASPPRERDVIWDTYIELFNGGNTTAIGNRGMFNKHVDDLKKLGATPDEMRRRLANLKATWPNATPTGAALVRHWNGEACQDKIIPPPGAGLDAAIERCLEINRKAMRDIGAKEQP